MWGIEEEQERGDEYNYSILGFYNYLMCLQDKLSDRESGAAKTEQGTKENNWKVHRRSLLGNGRVGVM